MAKNDKTQAYKDEIKAWLNSEDQDFDLGYDLFVRFAHNRALALFLARKRKLSKLVYELQKIVDRDLIKEAPNMPIKPIKVVVKTAADKQSGVHEPGKRIEDNGRLKVAFDSKVNYEDLPEDMKKLYDATRDRYKRMRAVHEQMKLAKTDDGREQARSSLVYLDDKIAEGWKILDEWAASKDKEQVQAEAKEAAEITKEINAARSYLSRNVKGVEKLKGVKRDQMIDKLKMRLDLLQKHKAEIKEATRKELFKIGLLTDWRDVH